VLESEDASKTNRRGRRDAEDCGRLKIDEPRERANRKTKKKEEKNKEQKN
jgi:hypothetical protein